MNKLLVIDFHSRFTKDIETILTTNNIPFVSKEHDCDISILKEDIKGIILTGSHDTVYDGGRRCNSAFFKSGIPILGICYGHQLSNDEFNGEVKKAKVAEIDKSVLFTIEKDHPIFDGMNKTHSVAMFHNDEVTKLGDGFVSLGHTCDCIYAAAYNEKYNIVTLQFHPEYRKYSEYADLYFKNYVKMCGL